MEKCTRSTKIEVETLQIFAFFPRDKSFVIKKIFWVIRLRICLVTNSQRLAFSFEFFQMLICLKVAINDLEQSKLPDTKHLVSLQSEKTEIIDADQDSGKIKIVAKLFLNNFAEDSIDEGLSALLENCSTTPTVILAYHPIDRTDSEKFIWADNSAKSKDNFKYLWKKLRAARNAGSIGQLGIADMDLATILEIFDDKNFDFTILQINTQTCCVVPPELQQFCKDVSFYENLHQPNLINRLCSMIFSCWHTRILWKSFHRRISAKSTWMTSKWSGLFATSKHLCAVGFWRRKDSSLISEKR